MKDKISTFLAVAILVLAYVLYQAWVSLPQKEQRQRNEAFTTYERCKNSASMKYSFNWFLLCKDKKSNTKDCDKLRNDGFPWDDYYQLDEPEDYNKPPEERKEVYDRFQAFSASLKDCSCPALPKLAADSVEDTMEKDTELCQKEFELKLKTLK